MALILCVRVMERARCWVEDGMLLAAAWVGISKPSAPQDEIPRRTERGISVGCSVSQRSSRVSLRLGGERRTLVRRMVVAQLERTHVCRLHEAQVSLLAFVMPRKRANS